MLAQNLGAQTESIEVFSEIAYYEELREKRFKRAYVLDQAKQILASKIIARYQHHTQQLLYKN